MYSSQHSQNTYYNDGYQNRARSRSRSRSPRRRYSQRTHRRHRNHPHHQLYQTRGHRGNHWNPPRYHHDPRSRLECNRPYLEQSYHTINQQQRSPHHRFRSQHLSLTNANNKWSHHQQPPYHHRDHHHQHHSMNTPSSSINYNQSHSGDLATNQTHQQTSHRTYPPEVIATFDLINSLNSPRESIQMSTKIETFYEVNPVTKHLSVNKKVKPITITNDAIESLSNIDFKEIPIDYNSLPKQMKDGHQFKDPQCLRDQLPPPKCRTWNTWNRTDPFVYEMVKIGNKIRMKKSNGPRVVTFRHNLRAIANMALYHLNDQRIYDRYGINIGIHRNGNDIFLENVLEKNEENWSWSEEMIYGNLLEHSLEVLSTTNNDGKKSNDNIEAMDYGKCLDRNEIRAFSTMRFGNDVECLCAAEMDAVMKEVQGGKERVIEIKSTKMKNAYSSKMRGILDWKLLKYWTQCRFGGVDAVLIVFHENGKVKKTEMVDTVKLEEMFPIITKKCIRIIHDVLKWIQEVMSKLEECKLYRLSFVKGNNGRKNTEIVLTKLKSDKTRTSANKWLNGNDEVQRALLSHGLVIDRGTGVISVESV